MSDLVNHPEHYKLPNGAEVIDITENLSFNRGNAVKYIARAGQKDPAKELEDLQKAQWYLSREITRLEAIDAEVVPRVWQRIEDVPGAESSASAQRSISSSWMSKAVGAKSANAHLKRWETEDLLV